MHGLKTLAGFVALFALAPAHPRTPDAPGEWTVVKPTNSAGASIYVDRSSFVRLPGALLVDAFFGYTNVGVYSRTLFSCQNGLTSIGYNGVTRKGGSEIALEWRPKISPDGWQESSADKQLVAYLRKQCATMSSQGRMTYWHPVTYSDDKYYSIDVESLQVRGAVRTFWQRSVPVAIETVGNEEIARPRRGPVVRTQFEADCVRRTSRIVAYVEDGKALESFASESTHQPLAPGSIGSFVARFVCDI